MTRVLAVDLAPGELRFVRAERRLGRVRLLDCARVACTTPAARRTALEAARAWGPDEVLAALPIAALAHRVLALPFRDDRRVRETVELELLGQLPVDPGDVAAGHMTLETTAEGSRVWAALARRRSVEDLSAALAEAGVPPVRIEAALLGVWHLVEPAQAVDAALVLADGARSALAVRRDGRLVGVRALAADPAVGADAFAPEVRWSLAALGGTRGIVLLGADASADLAERLAQACGIGVVALADVAQPAWRAGDLATCAIAAGLAAGPGLVLDAAVDVAETARRTWRIGALAAAAALLVAADIGLVRWQLARRDTALVAAVQATAAAALPPGTRLVAPRTQLEAAAGSLGARPAAASQVLALLRDLSARVPAGVRLELDELTLDGDVVRLHGRTDRFETVDVVTRALGTSAALHDVTAEDSRAAVDGRGVEFGVRATWRPTSGAPS